MERLPIGLDLQPNEASVRHWSLWRVGLYLTEERLIIYENDLNCTVARLDHIASVQSTPTVNSGQQSAGWVLLVAGTVASLLALFQMVNNGAYGYDGQSVILVLAGGIVVAVIGLLLLFTARRTELYVTLSSSERVRLAPRGYSDTRTLESVMKDLGNALARPQGGVQDEVPERAGT